MPTFNEIAYEATKIKSKWNNKQKAQFHYFNENGLVAQKRKLDDEIRDLVDAGKIPSGWHVAYGTFNHYRVDRVIALTQQSRVGRIDYEVATEMLQDEITKIRAKLDEVKAA